MDDLRHAFDESMSYAERGRELVATLEGSNNRALVLIPDNDMELISIATTL